MPMNSREMHAEMEGAARTAGMQQWTASIKEHGHQPSLRAQADASHPPAPDSPCRDAEWQQLQARQCCSSSSMSIALSVAEC